MLERPGSTAAIAARDLTMTYRVPLRDTGVRGAMRGLVRRKMREVRAVDGISFDVGAGEVVGLLGPNGAGKTTTMKMLAGVLHPTAGQAEVLGYRPGQRHRSFLQRIALIRGSRPFEPLGELTVMDILRFQRLLYDVSEADFARNLDELRELLEIGPLEARQVRALSLGERMRVGLANALIYRPSVLFLDEPTIGLDVTATANVRRFIADYCQATGATALLTSHAMGDVEALCSRIVLIDAGVVRYDGPLDVLAARLAPWKIIRIAVEAGTDVDWSAFGTIVAEGPGAIKLRVDRTNAPAVTAKILAHVDVVDLAVEDPPLEAVIDLLYRGTST
jgi:ABC-2 type transport system ATP-binding protein